MTNILLYFCFLHTDSEVRPVDPNYADGYKVMFADGYPFLLISQVNND